MASLKITEKGERKTAIDNLIQAAVIYGVLLAVFSAYFSVFAVEITSLQVLFSQGMVTLFLLLLMWNRKHRIKKIIVAVFLVVLVCVIYYKSLLGGVSSYINRFVELYNKYHKVTMAVMIAERTPFSSILTITVLGFVLGLVLYLVLDNKKGVLLSLLVILLPVIISAIVGKMPEFTKFWMLLVMICIYLKMYHRGVNAIPRKEIVVTAGVLAVLMVVSSIVQPMITNYKNLHLEEYKQIRRELILSQKTSINDLKTSIKKWKNVGGDFGGGVSKGNLRNQTSFNPTGETEMYITLNYRPTEILYLKGYVGAEYRDESWKEVSASKLKDVIPLIGGADESRAILNEPFRQIAEGENNLIAAKMKVKLVNASREFEYMPYQTEITEKMNVYLDSYVKGGWGKDREYTYFAKSILPYDIIYSSYYMGGDSSWFETGAKPTILWEKYEEMVKKVYTNEYPELRRLNELCEQIGFNDPDMNSLQGKILYWFGNGYYYSRNPGEMPLDMDLIEGFLFEKKTGFCVHFASAATLIYQICGVPARYVEGYAVSPEQFVRYEDGTFRATVTDENAHAWCEVFVEKLGWQVREHTVRFGEEERQSIHNLDQKDEQDESQEIVENEVSEQVIPQENNPQQGAGNVDNSNENDIQGGLPSGTNGGGDGTEEGVSTENNIWSIVKRILLVALSIAGTMAIFMFVIILQQRIRRARRLQSFRQKKDNKGVLSIYNAIYDMCTFAEFWPEEEEWTKIYRLAEQAAFSDKIISKEEQKEMYHLYRRYRKDILEVMNFKNRLIFLYIKAF